MTGVTEGRGKGATLICPCGNHNPEGAKFCLECGAPIARRCTDCAVELPPGAKFCPECGRPASGARSEPARRETRKVVTVVFVDLAGSTSLQEHMDPESVRRVMERFSTMMRSEIEAAEGLVVKLTGDGLMAGFGIREAREDDALRAVRAAVAMQESFREFAAEVSDTRGADVSLRVGINTGEVVVAEEDDDVVGDVVNVAARLEHAAGDGNVLVGDETWRLTRDDVSFAAVEPLELKGKDEPVPAYRVVSLEPPTEDDGVAAPFVGRGTELARLHEAFERSVSTRSPSIITVVGSPGLGKTRIASEFVSAVSGHARVLEARCDRTGTTTYAPIAEALREAAGIAETASGAEVIASIQALVSEDFAEKQRVAKVVASLLGVGEAAAPQETFWAVRRLLEGLAAVQPVVLVVDDVQWAEPMMLDLLDHLVEWAKGTPIMILPLARPEIRDVRPSLLDAGSVVLEGLNSDDTAALAASLLGAHDLPSGLVDRILTTTEGNPLFVRELLRMLVDDGVLHRDGERWVATVQTEEIHVPPTINALLSARIERLQQDERAVVERASVVGKEFYRGAVVDLVPANVGSRIDTHLETLRRKELVEPEGTYWIDERVFRFHHVLIRDAAYRRLLKEARAELHERFADWLEAKVGDLVGEHDEVLGYHLEQAHTYLDELGVMDEHAMDLGRRASAHLASATRRALDRDDLAAAANLSERALLLTADDAARALILLDRCEALLGMGDVGAARDAVAELRARASDDRLRAWADCFDGQLAILTDPSRLRETATIVEDAARRLAELGDDTGAAKGHAVHAEALAHLGQFGACEAALDRALAAARESGDRRRANGVLSSAPLAALWGPNPVPRASGRCLDVVRVLRITQGAPAVEATALRCQAVLEAMRGRTDAAHRMLASARSTLEELGLRHALVECDLFTGLIDLLAGDYLGAEASFRSAYEGFRGLNVGTDTAQAAALLARALVEEGRDDEALELTEESERLGGDDLKTAIAWRTVRARALARRGNLDAATGLARAAVALAEPTDALIDHADARLALAEVLRAAGRDDDARTESRKGEELYARKEATGGAATPVIHPPGDEDSGRRAGGVRLAPGIDPGKSAHYVSNAKRYRSAMLAHDWTTMTSFLTPDHVFVDHRSGLQSELTGGPEWVEVMRTVWENLDADLDLEFLAQWADDVGLLRLCVFGDGWEKRSLSVHLGRDGLNCRTEEFDEHDDAAAFARLDELAYEVSAAKQAIDAYLDGTTDQDPHGLTGAVPLAASGDAALVRIGEAFAVVRTSEGQLVGVDVFDPDDELGARRRLQEIAPSPSYVCWFARYHFDRHGNQDWEALRVLNAADVQLVDHRPVGWGTVHGIDRVIDLLQEGARTASMTPEGLRILEWLAITDNSALYRYRWAGTTADGIEFGFDRLMLTQLRDGVCVRAETFDPEQIDEARRRMAEGHGSEAIGPLDAFGRRWEEAFRAGDGAELAALYTPGFRVVEHNNHIELDLETHLDSMRRMAAQPNATARVETVVRLGARHGVNRTIFSWEQSDGLAGSSEVVGVSAVRLDQEGRCPLFEWFPAELLHRALARAEELYIEEEATGQALAGARRRLAHWRMADAHNDGDWETFAALWAPDAVLVDRRRIGWAPTKGREPIVELIRAISARSVRHTWSITDVHAVADDGCVYTLPTEGIDRDGGRYEQGGVCVSLLTDEGLSRVEIFPFDAVDEALRRFEELRSRAAPDHPPATSPITTLERAWRRWLAAQNARDTDSIAAQLAPDFVLRDHVYHFELDREATLADLQSVLDVPGSFLPGRALPLGDRHGVLEFTWSREQGRTVGESHMTRWFTVRCDSGGRVLVLEWYSESDLLEALERAEELYLEDEATGEQASWSRQRLELWRVLRAYNAGDDADQIIKRFRPDIVTIDHRPVGTGELRGAEAWVSWQNHLSDTTLERRFEIREVRFQRNVLWLDMATVGTDAHGGSFEMPVLRLAALGSGRQEWFSPEQREDAERRFLELVEESIRSDPAEDHTTIERTWSRWLAAVEDRDMDTVADLLAPSYRCHEHAFHLDMDRETALADFERVLARPGSVRGGRTVVFGDRHALCEMTWSGEDPETVVASEVTVWRASRCGPDGRLLVVDVYAETRMAEALERAERLYLEDEAAGEDATASRRRLAFWRTVLAYNAGDWDGVRSGFHRDVTTIDHRPAGWGRLEGRDAYLETIRGLAEMAPDRRWDVRSLEFEGACLLLDLVVVGTDENGGRFVLPYVAVIVVGDGGVETQALFTPEQREKARACYATLVGLHAQATGSTIIERAWESFLSALNERDLSRIREMHAPDFRLIERAFHLEMGLDDQLTNLEGILSSPGSFRSGRSFTLGERHGALEMIWSLSTRRTVGESEVRTWSVNRCNADGVFLNADIFPENQMREALERAEELYLEDEASPDDADWSEDRLRMWRAFRAYNAGDADA